MSEGDEEFKATFSLLPHLLKLLRTLDTGGNSLADPQQQTQIQNTIGELQAQLQRCHHLLGARPYLDRSLEEQKALLARKKEQLKNKCELLLMYNELDVCSAKANREGLYHKQ